jgi:GTP cyclohydrolase I
MSTKEAAAVALNSTKSAPSNRISKTKLKAATKGIRALLEVIGENPDREGLLKTPHRVVKAFLEMTEGLAMDPIATLGTVFKEDIHYDEIILKKNIEFNSLCEHHLLNFTGHVDIAYIPNQEIGVVGLSKLSRVVDVFAKRPQVQERMTVQIADAIEQALKPAGVAVRVTAMHSCVRCRGVQKQNAEMVTQVLRGEFREKAEVRQEFSDLLQNGGNK